MSPTLIKAATELYAARSNLGHVIIRYGGDAGNSMLYAEAPPHNAAFDHIDAWCDYAIAKARYERLLVRERRGVEL